MSRKDLWIGALIMALLAVGAVIEAWRDRKKPGHEDALIYTWLAALLLAAIIVFALVAGGGQTHVFTAMELPGFHIGSSRLEHAFNKATEALNEHVSKLFKCEATYQLEFDYDAFLAQIGSSMGPLVVARREPAASGARAH